MEGDSGNAQIEHIVKAFDSGASGFLPKPFKREEQVRVLRNVLPYYFVIMASK